MAKNIFLKSFRIIAKSMVLLLQFRNITIIYTPQWNVDSKNLNQTMLEKVNSMLSQSGLPYEF